MKQRLVTEFWLVVQSPEGQVTSHGPYHSQDAMWHARAGWNNMGYKTIVKTRKIQKQVY